MADLKDKKIQGEALTIVYAIKKINQYLFGRHFVLYTDHNPSPTVIKNKKEFQVWQLHLYSAGLFYYLYIVIV